jgi:hypothetical protein
MAAFLYFLGHPMKRIVGMTIAALVLWPSLTEAQFISGNELFGFCSATQSEATFNIQWGQCWGYIMGVADALSFMSRICLNSEVTTGQIRDVAIRYLVTHPEKRHLPANFVVSAALSEAFPCR